MSADISKEDLLDWLNTELIDSVEEITSEEREEEFRLRIIQAGYEVIIFKSQPEGPIRIGNRVEFPQDFLATLMTRGGDRYHLSSLFASVLTNITGTYAPLDDDGNSCHFYDMRYLKIDSYIYPDGASQDRVMNQILDITTAIAFVTDMVETYDRNLSDQAD